MTKLIAINGSPRKKWNTATLLQNAVDGAISVGAQTELGEGPEKDSRAIL